MLAKTRSKKALKRLKCPLIKTTVYPYCIELCAFLETPPQKTIDYGHGKTF